MSFNEEDPLKASKELDESKRIDKADDESSHIETEKIVQFVCHLLDICTLPKYVAHDFLRLFPRR